MLDQLLATSGVDERFVARSRVGFCALHGGLEEGTAEIAGEAAERAGASFYAVVQPTISRGMCRRTTTTRSTPPSCAHSLRA